MRTRETYFSIANHSCSHNASVLLLWTCWIEEIQRICNGQHKTEETTITLSTFTTGMRKLWTAKRKKRWGCIFKRTFSILETTRIAWLQKASSYRLASYFFLAFDTSLGFSESIKTPKSEWISIRSWRTKKNCHEIKTKNGYGTICVIWFSAFFPQSVHSLKLFYFIIRVSRGRTVDEYKKWHDSNPCLFAIT